MIKISNSDDGKRIDLSEFIGTYTIEEALEVSRKIQKKINEAEGKDNYGSIIIAKIGQESQKEYYLCDFTALGGTSFVSNINKALVFKDEKVASKFFTNGSIHTTSNRHNQGEQYRLIFLIANIKPSDKWFNK